MVHVTLDCTRNSVKAMRGMFSANRIGANAPSYQWLWDVSSNYGTNVSDMIKINEA